MLLTRVSMYRLLFSLLIAATLPFGCDRKPAYSQSTPDEVIRSAAQMVKSGDTRKLTQLIYADSAPMRQTLDQLGVLLANMQDLSLAAAKAYPEEFAELRERARKAAEGSGGPQGLLSMIQGGSTGGGRGRRGPPSEGDQEQFRDAINQLFADPFGWLELNADRITTVPITDDTAAVMLDGEPIIPVVGLPLQLEDGKWYIRLPTQLPGVADAMPQTRQQWAILRQVIRVVDNAVVEMNADVRAGRMGRGGLGQLAERAQEKLTFPAVIAFAAYGKEMDVRQRTQRRTSHFAQRQREWVKSRAARAGLEDDQAVAPSLRRTLTLLAPAEFEQAVRKNQPGGIDRLSDGQFEELVTAWLDRAGLSAVDLRGELSPAVIDPAIAAWEAERAKAGKAGR